MQWDREDEKEEIIIVKTDEFFLWKREDISSDKNKKPNEVLYWAAINWKTLFFNQNETFKIYFDLLKKSIVYHILDNEVYIK